MHRAKLSGMWLIIGDHIALKLILIDDIILLLVFY
jgi:hypothetical protein